MARFGYNRYALVLAALAFTGVGAGCGGSSSSRGSGSAVAPATSGSTAAPTTSSSTPAGAAVLASVDYLDADGSQTINKGDRLIVSFTGPVTPVAVPNTIDPALEFSLAVGGDSFGLGATLEPMPTDNQVAIVLGDNPVLRVTGAFDPVATAPGAASGLNVSIFARGDVKSREGARVVAAPLPVDIGGSLQEGFRPAASMNVARGGHAAVALDDGRVLVVGGIAAGGGKAGTYVADAELFDPLTNQWTKVSDLSGTRNGRMMNGSVAVKPALTTATKLNDGTVLICGGIGVEKKGLLGLGGEKVDTLETAFIFDPQTNAFTKVGNLNWPRHSHTATRLSDGRVLIAGGYNDSFWRSHKTQAPFEIYDPAKKSFEKSGTIFSRFKSIEARQGHTATSIEGGSGVLLAGGNHWEGGGLFGLIKPKLKINKGSEVVRGLKSDKAGDLNRPRLNHAAAAVGVRVLLAGGHDAGGAVGELELYDPNTATWSVAGSLTRPRSNPELAVDRTLALVIGGFDGTAEVATVEAFDADAGALSATTYQLATPRNGCAVVTLKDGRILVTGGFTGGTKSFESLDGQALDSCEAFVRQ
ncbi:MAG: hypothetical protein M9894_25235 [Planctomycetes bacterium]|nr:hypothetical protein [Planctomycetota bacterium]